MVREIVNMRTINTKFVYMWVFFLWNPRAAGWGWMGYEVLLVSNINSQIEMRNLGRPYWVFFFINEIAVKYY